MTPGESVVRVPRAVWFAPASRRVRAPDQPCNRSVALAGDSNTASLAALHRKRASCCASQEKGKGKPHAAEDKRTKREKTPGTRINSTRTAGAGALIVSGTKKLSNKLQL